MLLEEVEAERDHWRDEAARIVGECNEQMANMDELLMVRDVRIAELEANQSCGRCINRGMKLPASPKEEAPRRDRFTLIELE